ncbi:MAG TPA: hypothetical protein VEJ16_09945 [Alphaproteobacteria bacterium]|nr:hypothetical protein [Alphaproteobacteria bacterium]
MLPAVGAAAAVDTTSGGTTSCDTCGAAEVNREKKGGERLTARGRALSE